MSYEKAIDAGACSSSLARPSPRRRTGGVSSAPKPEDPLETVDKEEDPRRKKPISFYRCLLLFNKTRLRETVGLFKNLRSQRRIPSRNQFRLDRLLIALYGFLLLETDDDDDQRDKMRLNRNNRPSQSIIVRMAEEEDDEGTDENDRPLSPTETTINVGKMRILLNDNCLKAGAWLKGKIVVEPGLPQISNLSLTLKGVALAHFMSDDGKEYKAKQEFLKETIELGNELTKENANEEISMPFQYRIPIDAPPSFVGNYGDINYECMAVLHFVSALTRKRVRKVSFQVLPKRSPNGGSCPSTPGVVESSHESQQNPSAKSIFYTHRLTSFGFFDGTVDIRLETDETNLRRGRTSINVVVIVANKTQLHLRDLRFGVLLTTEWNAKGRRITERKWVNEERKDDFYLRPSKEIRLEKSFASIPIDLPPTVEFAVDANSSPVCRCSYTVFAKLIPPNFAKTCMVEIPLNVF